MSRLINHYQFAIHYSLFTISPPPTPPYLNYATGFGITQYYPPETGAPHNRLSDLARRLADRGHRVEVLTALPNYPGHAVFEAAGVPTPSNHGTGSRWGEWGSLYPGAARARRMLSLVASAWYARMYYRFHAASKPGIIVSYGRSPTPVHGRRFVVNC